MTITKDLIKNITARQILDSRGYPTLEVTVLSTKGHKGTASVPSGASTGKNEAWELRDGGQDYLGKGVMIAIEHINTELSRKLKNLNIFEQKKLDQLLIDLDGSDNKRRLGGNTILAISLAVAKTAALSKKIPLYKYLNSLSSGKRVKMECPKPMYNLINGGLHAGNDLDIQEFLFIPRLDSYSRGLQMAVEVYHHLQKILEKDKYNTGLGDEGGFAPDLDNNHQAFELIIRAAQEAGYSNQNFSLGIDAAANSFVVKNNDLFYYKMKASGDKYNSTQLINLYKQWIDDYSLVSIEDGLAEDDTENWRLMTKLLKDHSHVVHKKIEIVGDDLFVTNAKRIIGGIEEKLATAVIIKPNQVGSLSEAIEAVEIAHKHDFTCIASHRSGETNDSFIADFAVAFGCEFIKAGAPARGERVAKYNRLLTIEKEL